MVLQLWSQKELNAVTHRSIWRGRRGFIYVLAGGKPNFLDSLIISAVRQLAVQLPADTSSLDYLNAVIPRLSALHVHNWGCEDSRALSAGRNLRELTLPAALNCVGQRRISFQERKRQHA